VAPGPVCPFFLSLFEIASGVFLRHLSRVTRRITKGEWTGKTHVSTSKEQQASCPASEFLFWRFCHYFQQTAPTISPSNSLEVRDRQTDDKVLQCTHSWFLATEPWERELLLLGYPFSFITNFERLCPINATHSCRVFVYWHPIFSTALCASSILDQHDCRSAILKVWLIISLREPVLLRELYEY
jgi:hypothetical protein